MYERARIAWLFQEHFASRLQFQSKTYLYSVSEHRIVLRYTHNRFVFSSLIFNVIHYVSRVYVRLLCLLSCKLSVNLFESEQNMPSESNQHKNVSYNEMKVFKTSFTFRGDFCVENNVFCVQFSGAFIINRLKWS